MIEGGGGRFSFFSNHVSRADCKLCFQNLKVDVYNKNHKTSKVVIWVENCCFSKRRCLKNSVISTRGLSKSAGRMWCALEG